MEKTNSLSGHYSGKLEEFKNLYHSQCLFNNNPPVKNLCFHFLDDGVLLTNASFDKMHQSYDNRVHGGLIAAIIDASMTQCLMGHSVVAYTVDLSVNYRKPIPINQEIIFRTEISAQQRNRIFTLRSTVCNEDEVLAEGKAKFFGSKQK